MDSDVDRNPSPPPELLQSDRDFVPDKLGDSVFSKHWVFQTLISIIQTVNKECANVPSPHLVQGPSDDLCEEPGVIELDSELEDGACTLWDMSANHDVACFLQEFRVKEIFLEVIEKTRSPRLLEIVVGILGNIASFDELCKDVSENSCLVNAIIGLSGSSDVPTVIQVLRLIHTGIVNKNTVELWIEVIKGDHSFMENMRFILENSLNGEVLKRCLQLLYYLVEKEDQWCIEWGTENQVKAVIEAGKQLNCLKNFEALDEFWMVLNLLCLHDQNWRFINAHFLYISQIFHDYLLTIDDYEDILPPVHRIATVSAAVSSVCTFMRFDQENLQFITKDDAFTLFLCRMQKSVCEAAELQHSNTEVTPLLGAGSPELDASSVIKVAEGFVRPHVTSIGNGVSVGNISFSGSDSIGKKIPSYNSCIAKTAVDCDNLLLLRECLQELCVMVKSDRDTIKN